MCGGTAEPGLPHAVPHMEQRPTATQEEPLRAHDGALRAAAMHTGLVFVSWMANTLSASKS